MVQSYEKLLNYANLFKYFFNIESSYKVSYTSYKPSYSPSENAILG